MRPGEPGSATKRFREPAIIDDTAVTRRINLMQLLRARRLGATTRELAREMQVSEKTIRRDLTSLSRANYLIAADTGQRGRKTWRYVGNGKPLPLNFTYDEAAALYVARRFLQPLTGTLLGDAADSALRKIRCTLGEEALELFERFQGAFHIPGSGAGDYAGKAEIIDGLQLSIEESKVARVTYRSQRALRPTARDLHPYTLVTHKASGNAELGRLDLVCDSLFVAVPAFLCDRVDVSRGLRTCRNPHASCG